MSKKSQKQIEIEKQYKKEVNRLNRFIKQAEKRGYRFPQNAIPRQIKKPTKASIERLKKIKSTDLYAKATALSESGKVISGTEKRKEEKRVASEKAWQTRRRKEDEKQLAEMQDNKSESNPFNMGQIVYRKIKSLISDYWEDKGKGARLLKDELETQIKAYGFKAVMYSISQAPSDVLELSEKVAKYRSGSPQSVNALTNLSNLISGEVPSMKKLKELEDTWSADYETF